MSTIQPPPSIAGFRGEWRFLSNFALCPWVVFEDMRFLTVEHAYQAAKTLDLLSRLEVQSAPNPGSAKALGQRVVLRAGWDQIKQAVMYELLQKKFEAGHLPDYRAGLLRTGDALLLEVNDWGDRYWGVEYDAGRVLRGDNYLGQLLMQLRTEIRS